MFLLFSLLLLPAQVMGSIMCYNCLHNPHWMSSVPPLFNNSYFYQNTDPSCMESPTAATATKHCHSFCIAQRLVQEHKENGKDIQYTAFFRACADDLVVGAISAVSDCFGVINYDNGILLGSLYMQYGNAFVCSENLCNDYPDNTETCRPCSHMGSNCGKCSTVDGYTAQCNCHEQSDHSITCPPHPPLPLTSTSTSISTTSSSATTSTTSSTTTSKATTSTPHRGESSFITTVSPVSSSPADPVTHPRYAVLSVGAIAGLSVGLVLLTAMVVSFVCWKCFRQPSSNKTRTLELAEMASRRPPTRREPPAFPQGNANHGQDSYYSVPPLGGTGCSKPLPPSTECPKPPPPYHCVSPSTYQVPKRTRFGKKQQEEPREASYVYSSEFGGSSMGYTTQEELENRLRTLY